MSERLCVTGCERPTRENRLLADHCAWELERALGDTPALVDELHTTLTRQSRMGDKSVRRGSSDPLPFDLRASGALDALRVTFSGWCIVLLGSEPGAMPPVTLDGMSRFMLARVDTIAAHEQAADIHGEVMAATRAGWRIVDRAPQSVLVGVCPCGEYLYARLGHQVTRCRGCGEAYDVAESRDRLWQALGDRLLTIGEIVSWGVQLRYVPERDERRVRNLLDQWVKRRRIVPHGVDRRGRPTYPFAATLTEALSAMRSAA